MKKGQITVFIILGLIIMIFFVMFLSLDDDLKMKNMELDSNNNNNNNFASEPINLFLDFCMRESVVEAMDEVFKKGGYYNLPEKNLNLNYLTDNEFFDVPYYFSQNQKLMPTVEFIEEQVSLASVQYFNICLDDFSNFEKLGHSVNVLSDPDFEINFFQGKTRINLNYLIEINIEGNKFEKSNFLVNLPFDFILKYDLIHDYIYDQVENPDFFMVGQLSTLSYFNNFDYDVEQFGDDGSEVLVAIKFDDDLFDGDLIYNFGLNFDWELQDVDLYDNEKIIPELRLFKISPIDINEHGIYQFPIEAQGEGLTFDLDTEIINIDSQSGVIEINTDNLINDEYWIFVKVTDIYNQEIMAPLYLNININDGSLPIIEEIDAVFAKVGENFSYKVTVNNPEQNDYLLFLDENSVFPIGLKEGTINLLPTEEMRGNYSIRVDVENQNGVTWERFNLIIE